MSDGIEIVRCSLSNGFDLVADMTRDKSRVEWTLRSPHDLYIRTPLTAAEAQLLMNMQAATASGRRFGVWIRPKNDVTATAANINRQRSNPSARMAFNYEFVPCPGFDGLTEGRYSLHHLKGSSHQGNACKESELANDYFQEPRRYKVLIDGDTTHSYAIVAVTWNRATERVEVAIRAEAD